MGKSSKDKGKRGERELAAFLRSHGFNAERGASQCKGGEDNPDVVGLPGFHCEVKRYKAPQCQAWFDQAASDCVDATPIVFVRGDRRPWLVILAAEEFLSLAKQRVQCPESHRQSNAGVAVSPCAAGPRPRPVSNRGRRRDVAL